MQSTRRRQRMPRVAFALTLLAGLLVILMGWAVYRWPVYSAINEYEPQLGDMVFQSLPHAPLVNTIEGVTQSPFSHCGLVSQRGDRWIVIEALNGVEETPLKEFLLRGRECGFAAYRLAAHRQAVWSRE